MKPPFIQLIFSRSITLDPRVELCIFYFYKDIELKMNDIKINDIGDYCGEIVLWKILLHKNIKHFITKIYN